MLVTIEQFRSRVESDSQGLIADLQQLTGRYGSDEAHAWQSSLSRLSETFKAPSFQPLHLYFGSRGHLALEYQLPASSSWCDIVLLGAHASQPSAVILELKDWLTRSDKPGRYEGLIERQGSQQLHPSDQVRGYVEYCRRFHSAVNDHGAHVHGCVLLTRDQWAEAYSAKPNQNLAAHYPLFTMALDDINRRFPEFFRARLTVPDEKFANAFADGRYRQTRGFVAQIGAQILNPTSNVFELLDNQRRAFSLCRSVIDDAFIRKSAAPPKRVIIVKGPPGSGKSVIAARLWAALVTDPGLPDGDVVFVTTSLSQNSNWSDLFSRRTGIDGASGVVRRATAYAPLSTQRLGQLRVVYGTDFLSGSEEWRDNLATLRALGEPYRDGACDDQCLVSIVDEAHGLINPEHRQGRGQFGFATTLGPQAYHIIRSSLLTVFLLDPRQAFRERENTSIDDLRRWSQELGAGEPEEISLEGAQFRCAGSPEFVAWIESLLSHQNSHENRALARRWSQAQGTSYERTVAEAPAVYRAQAHYGDPTATSRMQLSIFDSPVDLEAALRARHTEGHTVRILSSYSRRWKTEKAANPHGLKPPLMDFHEEYRVAGRVRYWSRIWNFIPGNGNNYTWYVGGHPGGRIAADPLCEVGCPYAVRGFDFDYIGILWLNDLLWTDSGWRVDPAAVEERGIKDLASAARREKSPRGPATSELLDRVFQAYRILFTRALKGVYVWVPHEGTREHLIASLA